MLLLDTYEAAAALDDWVRERFLASLPSEVLVVIAGRFPPSAGWSGDVGWHELLRVVSLRNLRPEDARALLHLQGTAPSLHDRAIELTHGHPLALSLVIDVLAQRSAGDAGAAIDLGDAPDVLRPLLERFVADIPGPRHLRALEACAHARFMTEDLLAAACGADDASALFAWLRTLSFVDETRDGLFPHDLARDVLDIDLRWRDREAYDELHRAIRRRLVQRIRATSGREQQRAAADLVFLHRRNPFTSAFWDWGSFGRALRGRAAPRRPRGDRGHGRAPRERRLGRARRALARAPAAGVLGLPRGERREPIGFSAMLALHAASADDLAADPGAQAMWEHARRHVPPRPGEEVYAGRFVVDRDHHQGPSALFNVVTFRSCQHWLSHPRLSWDFLGCWTDPAAIEPMMSYIDYERVPEADYEVGGTRYGVFAHDWRRVDADAWLDLMADRELEAGFDATLARGTAVPVLALSQPEFDSAARSALRELHRPDALAANLLRTRVVQDREGAGAGPQVLRDLVEEAVGALRADPRDEKLVRAIERTYLRPAPTQERAAEVLGLPFSTYRRHLAAGVQRIVDWLWQRELYGAEQ